MVPVASLTGCPGQPSTGISMLLCPEQNHTSPIRILLNDTDDSLSRIVMVYVSVDASGVGTENDQFPSESAFTLCFLPFQETFISTVSSGLLQPQRRTSARCCSTILSLNTPGSSTACAVAEAANSATIIPECLIMILILSLLCFFLNLS